MPTPTEQRTLDQLASQLLEELRRRGLSELDSRRYVRDAVRLWRRVFARRADSPEGCWKGRLPRPGPGCPQDAAPAWHRCPIRQGSRHGHQNRVIRARAALPSLPR
jgi:hypothetical protein